MTEVTSRTTRAQRMAMPLAREVVKDLAVEHGACIRPIQLRRTNLDTGEQDTVLVPCGHTLAHVCPSCAERARTLRAAQCREGWHLEDEPAIEPDPATEDQKFWVETRAEARQCADLFRAQRHRMDGIIVTLPNFGDERGIAESLRMADLRVPVLIQATPDSAGRMTIADRRDSFCGKMSVCNNLQQYRIPYSLTSLHTEAPDSPEFARDIAWFAAVCRVANGMKRLRIVRMWPSPCRC